MLSSLFHLLFVFGAMQMAPQDGAALERAALGQEQRTGLHDALFFIEHLSPVNNETLPGPTKMIPESAGVVVSSHSAIVQDRESGKILYEKNAHEERAIGSITKLMTACVFLQSDPDLSAVDTITPEDVRLGGVQHLMPADPVKVMDLLKASLVGSDNSATAALMRLSSYNPEAFVDVMNTTAKEWGLTHTHFVDSTGLSNLNRSTAQEVAIILHHVLQIPLISEITRLQQAVIVSERGNVYHVGTTNELLTTFVNQAPYALIGGKTGYLPEAGYSFGSIFSKDQEGELIVVTLGAPTDQERFGDTKALAWWGYKVYDWE